MAKGPKRRRWREQTRQQCAFEEIVENAPGVCIVELSLSRSAFNFVLFVDLSAAARTNQHVVETPESKTRSKIISVRFLLQLVGRKNSQLL